MRTKYPSIEPNQTGHLEVDSIHRVYFEECGNPDGVPVIFLHGGPGSGLNSGHRSYFNPDLYRIILIDQRGSGKSTPHAELKNNTTFNLAEDLEKLKKHLKIDSWVVFGGSWGSTLALYYAEMFPKSVKALILRGIFLGRKKEIEWFYQNGAHNFFSDEWEKYISIIPEEERGDLVKAYYKRLTSDDPHVRKTYAKAWTAWESVNLRLLFDQELFDDFMEDFHADALARVECHYFINGCFFESDNQLLENIDRIRHIPAVIIQGRYDMVCPFISAWELHKAWPESTLQVIPDAGHAAGEVGITDALIETTDYFGKQLSL